MGLFRILKAARLLVIALYALAAVSVGFAHKTSTTTATSIELAAYTLPDGSVLVICGDVGSHDADHGSKHISPVCDACRLVGAPGMVSASECWVPLKRLSSSLQSRVTSDRVVIRKDSHVPHLRGPPKWANRNVIAAWPDHREKIIRVALAAWRTSAGHMSISCTVSCRSDQSKKYRAGLAGRLLDTMKG